MWFSWLWFCYFYGSTAVESEVYNISLIIQLSNAGGRLIIASDGIWDSLSSDVGAQSCRGLPAELAAKLVVKVMFNMTFLLPVLLFLYLFCLFHFQEALRSRGLKDDTTCLVVDIIPFDRPILPPTPMKKQNLLSSLIFGKKSQTSANKATNKLSAVGVVEELFEEGSAMLTERYITITYLWKNIKVPNLNINGLELF